MHVEAYLFGADQKQLAKLIPEQKNLVENNALIQAQIQLKQEHIKHHMSNISRKSIRKTQPTNYHFKGNIISHD